MVRKKGDTEFSKGEKNMMIALINDYKLFNASDYQMIKLISQKIGRDISKTLFRSLKKESDKRGLIASDWLDRYVSGDIIDHYWKRIKELEYGQRIILERLAEEHAKGDKANKYLINQYVRTLGETATKLSEMGMSPPVMAKIYTMIPKEILSGNVTDPIQLEQYMKQFDTNSSYVTKEKAIPKLVDNSKEEPKKDESNTTTEQTTDDGDDNEINPLGAETAILPPIDKKNDVRPDGGTESETATAQGDQPVF
ncbi:MAG: hypothetical protein R2685_08045 [Candidatus Nitrosocosmicus sp.]|nr:hypothetical protein [Candidatus Nitrosocosmicus sp.]